jgi:hypothetical protein
MKHLIMICAFAGLLAMPLAASAQNTAPKPNTQPAVGTGTMMNCPMMAGMSGMQNDMGGMMSDMQAMMKDAKDPALKERMQRMHDHMSAMMASMQKMGSMGTMMGGQQPTNTTPAKPETAPSPAPASPEDHAAHHPAQ